MSWRRDVMTETQMRTGHWSFVDCVLIMVRQAGRTGGGEMESRRRLGMVMILDVMTFLDILEIQTHRILIIEVVSPSDRLGRVDTIIATFNGWCWSW